jgi:hypothetical protein
MLDRNEIDNIIGKIAEPCLMYVLNAKHRHIHTYINTYVCIGNTMDHAFNNPTGWFKENLESDPKFIVELLSIISNKMFMGMGSKLVKSSLEDLARFNNIQL